MFFTCVFRQIAKQKSLPYIHRNLSYVQGQSPSPKTREYFYYVDHQGQLFLDDVKMKNFTSCFKEKEFLAFFFKRVKKNTSGRYEEDFPYISPCGREMNYIRCDDRPIVFTQILHSPDTDNPDLLSYGGAGDALSVPFRPDKLCMLPSTGRIYHPCPEKMGRIGLIKSSIAIDISPYFKFAPGLEYEPPTHFNWKGVRFRLTNEMVTYLEKEES